MAEIQITVSADDLATPDDLFGLVKELQALGWRGSVKVGPMSTDPEAPMTWMAQMHIDDPTAMDGSRSLQATLGDKKVVIGTTYAVMTQAAYESAYGGAQ